MFNNFGIKPVYEPSIAEDEMIRIINQRREKTMAQYPQPGMSQSASVAKPMTSAERSLRDKKLAADQQAGQITQDRNPSTEAILEERGLKYGSFSGHARVTQTLKRVLLEHMQHHNPEGFQKLMSSPTAFEGMEMIMHKLGRIANGDPLYKDNWDDIAGYAKLVADEMEF